MDEEQRAKYPALEGLWRYWNDNSCPYMQKLLTALEIEIELQFEAGREAEREAVEDSFRSAEPVA